MKPRSFYLAHPVILRHEVRKDEIWFERQTGINLVNPFYDGIEADIISVLDTGKITLKQYSARLNTRGLGSAFIEGDLKNIKETDGVVAVFRYGIPTIGTSMEVWEALRLRKPIYIVTDFQSHIWLQYVAKVSGGFIVPSFKQLATRLKQ